MDRFNGRQGRLPVRIIQARYYLLIRYFTCRIELCKLYKCYVTVCKNPVKLYPQNGILQRAILVNFDRAILREFIVKESLSCGGEALLEELRVKDCRTYHFGSYFAE